MKLITNLMIALLLGLAISITDKNSEIQSELNELNNEALQNEWVKAGVELNHINKALNVVGDYGK